MAINPARAARVWAAAALVAGALLTGAAPAAAAATTEPASQAAVTTSTLQAPSYLEVWCSPFGGGFYEINIYWQQVDGAQRYEFFLGGQRVETAGHWGDGLNWHYFFLPDSFDPNQTWTVRAVDASGNVSPMSNGVKARGC